MTAVTAEPGIQAPAPNQQPEQQGTLGTQKFGSPASSASSPLSGLPFPLLLAGAVGSTALGLGLGALLLLRKSWSRGRRGSSSSGGGKSGSSAGPCSKLKPTSRCVPLADGNACVIRREIAADNSCLFNSVGYAMHKSRTRAPHLRNVVARQVASDRATYSDAFLGVTNEAYCHWIRQPYNWGGGIELSILAQAYGVEIAAWNIESRTEHVFGEESGYKRQVMVIYNGVHYDALAVCAGPRANPEDDETSYNPRTKRGKMIIAAARKLVELAHKESLFHGASVGKQQQQRSQSHSAASSLSATSAPPTANGTATAAAGAAGSSSSNNNISSSTAVSAARKAGTTKLATRRVARGAATTTTTTTAATATTSLPATATTAADNDGSSVMHVTSSSDADAAADGTSVTAATAAAVDGEPSTADAAGATADTAIADTADDTTAAGARASETPTVTTASSKLSCGDCGTLCDGMSEAQQHALATGHQNFEEVVA